MDEGAAAQQQPLEETQGPGAEVEAGAPGALHLEVAAEQVPGAVSHPQDVAEPAERGQQAPRPQFHGDAAPSSYRFVPARDHDGRRDREAARAGQTGQGGQGTGPQPAALEHAVQGPGGEGGEEGFGVADGEFDRLGQYCPQHDQRGGDGAAVQVVADPVDAPGRHHGGGRGDQEGGLAGGEEQHGRQGTDESGVEREERPVGLYGSLAGDLDEVPVAVGGDVLVPAGVPGVRQVPDQGASGEVVRRDDGGDSGEPDGREERQGARRAGRGAAVGRG
ncbi:hypothetical protein ABZ372_44050, partial [Streptomyces sp. NPDC005921]